MEGAFIHAGSATVSTTAEITGMKAAKRVVGAIIIDLADWLYLLFQGPRLFTHDCNVALMK